MVCKAMTMVAFVRLSNDQCSNIVGATVKTFAAIVDLAGAFFSLYVKESSLLRNA